MKKKKVIEWKKFFFANKRRPSKQEKNYKKK